MSPAASNKILIMAGGTGGHVFPALTIAEVLLESGAAVEWLGTRQGIEASVLGKTSIPLHFISINGLRGKNLLRKLIAPVVVALAVCQAMIKIYQIKPACVLGMGGYVSGPGGIAAWLMRKPLLIHEQNAIAGLTNYLLHPFAKVVMEGFMGAFGRKQAITSLAILKNWIRSGQELPTGNPVRSQLANAGKGKTDPASRRFRILVLGGSLGATAINEVVPAMLKLFTEDQRPAMLHQCGNRNLGATLAAYHDVGLGPSERLEIVAFIDDMTHAYHWADLVICRSGASTIAELAAMGLPSFLIPYGYAVDDHQTENARVMVSAGGARLIEQSKLTAEYLHAEVQSVMQDFSVLNDMHKAALTLSKPESAQLAADLCLEACRG